MFDVALPAVEDSTGLLPFIARVERKIADAVAPQPGHPRVLSDASKYLCLAPGAKRMRPWLVYLFGEAVGAGPSGLVNIATAAELIHAASLLHDDVVDDGQERRGRPTVNVKWGNSVAVLSGDWVLSEALQLLRELPPLVLVRAVEVVRTMTSAAMKEIEAEGQVDFTVTSWRDIAEGKTGSLFAWCGESAALAAHRPDAVERFSRFGKHLGVAFQMADDLKDVLGGDPGKDRFSDIRNRTPSLPIVTAASTSRAWRAQLGRVWERGSITAQEASALGQSLIESGAAESAIAALEHEVASSLEALGPDRDSPWGREMAHLARKFSSSLRGEAAVS